MSFETFFSLRYLKAKQPYASYMITQMCFDPEVIVEWLRRVRAEGVDLPVHLGVPGVAERAKLLKIALKIGVGQSKPLCRSDFRALLGAGVDVVGGGGSGGADAGRCALVGFAGRWHD